VILIVLFHPLFWATAVLLGAALFTGTSWLKIAALSAAGLCVLDFAGVELVEKEMRAVLRDMDFRPPSRMPV
jgi:hypothetical protein